MFITLVITSHLLIGMLLILYSLFTDFMMNEKFKLDILSFVKLIIFSMIPLVNLIALLVIVDDDIENLKELEEEINKAKYCKNCEITSRKWQFITNNTCPQCEEKSIMKDVNGDLDYSFAKKLKGIELIKYKKYGNSLKKENEKLKEIERLDKEMKAWTKLQEKKNEEILNGSKN